jgi:hypothetical protein
MRAVSIALVASLLLAATALGQSNYAPASLDHYFRLEWQTVQGPRGPVVEGYVHNLSAYYAVEVRSFDFIGRGGL